MTLAAIRRAAVALCLVAPFPAAAAEPVVAPALIEAIQGWLGANFAFPPAARPIVQVVPAAELVRIRYGTDHAVPVGDVLGVYHETSSTILLSEGWTARSPEQLSILVHEMVHHLQAASNMRFACPMEREAVAYRAQDAWLRMFGSSLDAAFGMDEADILVLSVCTY